MVAFLWSRLVLPLVVLAVAGAAAWGVALRLVDPLSTSVIPAEDPYTHLALTREHLRDGSLEALNGDGAPYPPGLHAVLATLSVHSGVALADLVRFAPVAFGAVAVVGTALALRRLDGNAAAVVGAVVAAVTPELVFRSQMMAPTALDLAVLPFVLLGLALTVRGRLGWAAPTAVLMAFLLASHPWVFGILGLAAGVFLLLALACPWAEAPRLHALGLALGILLVGIASAFALSGCWGVCGPGFAVVDQQEAGRFDELAAALLGVTVLVAAACLVGRAGLQRRLDRQRPRGPVAATLWSAGLVGAAGYALWKAGQAGYPSQVSVEYMLGWPLVAAAFVGLAAVPWARRPGAHVAAALVAATLPFTVFDPFHSPFWPHRTAAYLAIGLAFAAGVAAGAIARFLAAAAAWSAQERPRPSPSAWTRAIVPGLLVGTLLGAGLVTAAPRPYPGGWYRLFDDCEAQALDAVAAQADADPRLVLATGSWQAKLVLAASADDAGRVWYIGDLLARERATQDLLRYSEDTGHAVLLVVERHALAGAGPAPIPLSPPSWQPAGSWDCATDVAAHLHTPT